jgi:ferric-dicitrate binding protein FerR (iron transport regulator)
MHVTGDAGTLARSVSLVGEAYFEVAPAPGRPFRVTAGHVTAEVLGTSFNVRRYVTDTAATVAVVSGKVRVQTSRAYITLTAGLMSQLSDSTPTASVARVGTDAAAWARGRLVFNNVPVPDLLTRMGRWYGYDFRIADSALAQTLTRARLTAEFRADAPAESMRLLKDLLDVTLTFDDTVVTLHARTARDPVTGKRNDMRFSPSVEVGRQ